MDKLSNTSRRLISAALTLWLLLGGYGVDAALALTLSVSPSGSDAGNCQGTPCRSITAAIANASAGDTINVAAGTYSTESFPLSPNNLSLIGASASTTIINAVGSGMSAVVFDDASFSQATLQGFTVKSDIANAISIYSSSGQAVSPAISANTIIASSSNGIYIYAYSIGPSFAVSSPSITGNTITGSLGHGIYIVGSSFAKIAPSITNNDIVANGDAGISMGIWLGASGAFINGTISANTISYNDTHGMYVWAASSGNAVINPSMSRNTITGNAGSAVYVSSNNTLDLMSPDFGGGSRGSIGLNTLWGNVFGGYFDLENSSVANTVSAMDNWFSSPARISNVGSAVVYSALSNPLIFSVSPSSGLPSGGTSLTITAASGSAFVTDVGAAHAAISVTIGGVPATLVSFSSGTLVVTAPSGAEGYADLTVTNPAGQSGTLADGYLYETPAAPDNPPTAPELLWPENGATGIISNSVTFVWSRSIDYEGSAVQYDLFVCTDSTFATCDTPVNPEQIAAASPVGPSTGAYALIAIAGIMAAGASLGRRRALIAIMLALALIAGIAACGNGLTDEAIYGDDTASYEVTSLSSATTYYWMVLAYDGTGNHASSSVSSFTTE